MLVLPGAVVGRGAGRVDLNHRNIIVIIGALRGVLFAGEVKFVGIRGGFVACNVVDGGLIQILEILCEVLEDA
jgi:hypothetical protein